MGKDYLEIWKDVKGYEGLYQVSDLGNVRGVKEKPFRKNPISNLKIASARYKFVRLSKNNRALTGYIHRLVAVAFIPNPENKPQVNHKNGLKHDNRVENLEWVTSFENQTHCVRTGLRKTVVGSDTSGAKLTEEKVLAIRASNLTMTELAATYGVGHATIHSIIKRRSWKHI